MYIFKILNLSPLILTIAVKKLGLRKADSVPTTGAQTGVA